MNKSAKWIGQLWGTHRVVEVIGKDVDPNFSNWDGLTNVIFEGMNANPYKGEKARRDFNEGVSQSVNQHARSITRKALYGNRNMKELGY